MEVEIRMRSRTGFAGGAARERNNKIIWYFGCMRVVFWRWRLSRL
jgi:hypothetical protein